MGSQGLQRPIIFCVVGSGRKQRACAPRETASYLPMCPGGWKGSLLLFLVLVFGSGGGRCGMGE